MNIIETVDMPRIYANDYSKKNQEKLNLFVDTLLQKVDYEVCKHGYIPQDFMFIFPIMKSNLLACELETKLNEYWIEKYHPATYTQYAILHRHEEGQVIDMTSSNKATRIVSIRTSKGDGRKVVFVLGCTEKSLKQVSREKQKGIVYESYLHVALTRAKEKVYFGLEKNNDDVHQRFGSTGLVEYKPMIPSSLSHSKILDNVDHSALIDLLKKNGVVDMETKKDKPKPTQDETPTIDWVYHCIRRAVYMQYATVSILQHTQDTLQWEHSQLRICLEKLSYLPVSTFSPNDFYKRLKSIASKKKEDIHYEMKYFPLCDMSHKVKSKTPYSTYCSQLKKLIEQNQNNYIGDPFSILGQTPREAVVQWYALELYRHHTYCEVSPMTIYNILHHFDNEDETALSAFLQESVKIKQTTDQAMESIFKTDNKVSWNIGHMVQLTGHTADVKVNLRYLPIVGNSKTCVYHFVFKTDFNTLNYWDTMVSIIIERFLIYNPQDKDVDRFQHKRIKTLLFVLKQHNYKVFEWDWDNVEPFSGELRIIVRDAIAKHFQSFNTQLFHYCSYIVKNEAKWKPKFSTPFDCIANEYSTAVYPSYISYFFKHLHDSWCSGNHSYVRTIVEQHETFCQALEARIKEMCNLFLGLNEHTEFVW